MATSVGCPDRRDLERLAQGRLDGPLAELLQRHVLACAPCAEQLDALCGADPLLGDLRTVAARPADDAGAAGLVERLLGGRPDAPSASPLDTPGPATTDAELPARLGRYQVLGRLGAGGMGVVVRAHDPQLRRDVAIKLPNFRGSGEAGRARFRREARAAAAVCHPNICPIYDVGDEEGRPYVVMALVEGESLAERLRRRGRLDDPHEAVALVVQVADALVTVHAAAIVHRDLKPGNILVDENGRPLLTDFGLAHADDGAHLTGMGELLGTPAYLAPEQAAPEPGAVGPWSDQYSLGVVLYQMLTGRLPFTGSVAALIHQIASRPVPPPTEHRADLDPALVAVLMRALARAPNDRYPAVADFAAALRAWHERPAPAAPAARPRDPRQCRVTLLQCGCDLFESPAVLAALDPEEQHELLQEFQQLCREAAIPLEGTVIKATDDGLLFAFGVPRAVEGAAPRAVRAGLNLLQRMAALNECLGRRHPGVRLSARAAVHSDRAVVTDDGSPCAGPVIVGPMAPAVAQLERLAEPDTLIVSDETHRLLRGAFACTDLGTPALRGPAGARPVFRVERELAGGEGVAGSCLRGAAPLVGRDREIALLQERWEQAVEGVGQVVLVVGEAGIGKSRQVGALKEHVAAQSCEGRAAQVIEWPCSPLHEVESFRCHAIASFERIMGIDPHDGPACKLDKLAAHLAGLRLATPEAVALLATLLSIPLNDRYPPPDLSPQRHKEKTFDLLLEWLRAHARRQPVLFVVEDLHWAGPTTLEFLDFLSGQVQDARLLVLLTARPEFVPPWRARGHQTQVALGRLSRRQIAELVQLKAGLPVVPPDVLALVAERTDGVPLFVEEFTAMLRESGGLQVEGGDVRLAMTFDARAIPAALHDLLLARLERVVGNLEVVQLASVIGREFHFELLAAVAPGGAAALGPGLAKLVEAELLFQHGRLPAARYQFKHALIRDAAYQSLLRKKRQEFHRRIAEAIERQFPDTAAARPEVVAHHFDEGAVAEKAVAYWRRAGEAAQQRGAAAEAERHFRRGLEVVQTLPESRQRHVHEIGLHIGLGIALAATRGFGVPELETTYGRAHQLCVETGLTDQMFPALFGQLRYYVNRSRHADAQRLCEEMLRFAEQTGDTLYLISAHCSLGLTRLLQGAYREAIEHLGWVTAIEPTADLRARHRYALVDPWVTAYRFQAWALWLLGYPDRAVEYCRKSLRIAEELNAPFSLGCALCYATRLYRFLGNPEEIREAGARALALGKEIGFVTAVALGRILTGWAAVHAGDADAGLAAIRQGLEELRAQAALSDYHEMLAVLADACAHAGRPEEGLKALGEALAFADATGEAFFQPETYRLQGDLMLQRDPGATGDAERCFAQALELARRQEARSLELRAAMSIARLWQGQGKTDAARELLAPVHGAFTEGFQTPDLQAARVLLEQLGGGPTG